MNGTTVQSGLTDGSENQLASVFEERAEHLSRQELEDWTAYTGRDEGIVGKLMGPGAKLLIGPRGSGKSTLLRTAYFRLIQSREALAVYVNYAKALALEPLLHKQANALQLFRQWLVMKIVVGVGTSLEEMQLVPPEDLKVYALQGRTLIQHLETGQVPDDPGSFIGPSQLSDLLEGWSSTLGFSRCVLLLDDAAHAFSPEQQLEFFEVFRELRSRRIAGKAAVYPGITSYSPHFHVGHEAETLEAWYYPRDDDYLRSMRDMVSRRLPPELTAQLADRQELVDLLALAAFGLPRGFLNMLSELFGVEEGRSVKPNRQRAEQAIRDHAESVRDIFSSLSVKLPRFKRFVEMGQKLEGAIVATLRKYNRLQGNSSHKATVIAMEEPLGAAMERMLNMLEYAGIARRSGTVSRGVKGRFRRYAIHNAILLEENSLSLGKSYPVKAVIEALTHRDAHAFARTKGTTLLGTSFEAKCTLDLPKCSSCGTPRASEEQYFCMKCGTKLTTASLYEELLRTPFERLPLTNKKVVGIKKHTQIRTMQDILLDDELQTLRRVPYIGSVWSERIRRYAEEFVSV